MRLKMVVGFEFTSIFFKFRVLNKLVLGIKTFEVKHILIENMTSVVIMHRVDLDFIRTGPDLIKSPDFFSVVVRRLNSSSGRVKVFYQN